VITLTEDELAEGVRLALRTTHNLAEGAGAAPLMAAMKLRDQLVGKKVVCVMSGGNIDRATCWRRRAWIRANWVSRDRYRDWPNVVIAISLIP
jgi:threonine dehydratase